MSKWSEEGLEPEQKQLVDAAFLWYRTKRGFPFPDVPYHLRWLEMRELVEVAAAQRANRMMFPAVSYRFPVTHVGVNTANSFHEHIWASHAKGAPSPLDAFQDDKVLKKALIMTLDYGEINDLNVRRKIRSVNGTQVCSNFRPATDPNGAIAPGSIAALFGSSLADDLQLAKDVPLPTTLGNTSVTFNGIPAPLFFVSSGQINAQFPFAVLPGEVSVQVKRGSETSAVQTVTIAAVSPGIYTLNQQDTGNGAILHAETFQAVNQSAPARPGEFLSIFCAGLGALQSPATSGDIPPTPPPQTTSQPQVNIAGIPGEVTYSGLAPGFVGLYQVNVQVPAGVPSGTQELQIIINGVPSNTVTIAVQ